MTDDVLFIDTRLDAVAIAARHAATLGGHYFEPGPGPGPDGSPHVRVYYRLTPRVLAWVYRRVHELARRADAARSPELLAVFADACDKLAPLDLYVATRFPDAVAWSLARHAREPLPAPPEGELRAARQLFHGDPPPTDLATAKHVPTPARSKMTRHALARRWQPPTGHEAPPPPAARKAEQQVGGLF